MIQKFENLILSQLENIVTNIIQSTTSLPIPAKSRAGAEISDWLEKEFVLKTKKHQYFFNSEAAPEGQTKNPWDARTFFKTNQITEEIWIDFKAIKITSADSNPNIGTPNKVVKFIEQGNFYIAFIYVYYQPTDDGLEFVMLNNRFTKTYFLKDIHHTFRRNPKNQLQVNISHGIEYRSREDFINLLYNKLTESHKRQIEISTKKLSQLDDEKQNLLQSNKISLERLLKNL